MEAYMGCMLEECVVRACYLRKHGNRERVNKWLIDWSIDGLILGSLTIRILIMIWKKNLCSDHEVLQLSVVLIDEKKLKATKKWPGILKSIIVYWLGLETSLISCTSGWAITTDRNIDD